MQKSNAKMMGRHWFSTNHRAEDAEKLTIRMKNGLASSKYKLTEYGRLQAIIDAKRLESVIVGQKVEKTRSEAKATKESSILQQHREVWCKEYPRLRKAEAKAEHDFYDFLEQIVPSGGTDTSIFSIRDYGLLLDWERDQFRIASVEPISQLKDNLNIRLGGIQRQQLAVHHSKWEHLIKQINVVKDQQDDINAKLHAEFQALEKEINGLGLEKYVTSTSENLLNLGDVPEDVLDSDCPYPELKESLIQTFHSLTQMYQNKLQSLQEQLQRADRFCGWCAGDHQRFLFTFSQYTHDIPNHRALFMDMLQRLFPEKTRQQLLEHERVWNSQRFTQIQLRVVTQQWQRDHDELLVRALVTLEEARHAHQKELELQKDRQQQQDICLQLREKLQQWRAQQEEVVKLEAVIAAREEAEEEARLKREQEKEMELRSQQKEKIREFHLKQKKRRKEVEERESERLAQLRSIMEEQARRDRKRVQFRADLLQQRRAEKEAEELKQQKEEEEKQHRLEALLKKIGVVAEADPERLMAQTEAWKSRYLNEEEYEFQRPLYALNTFTETQIMADPRARIEQALREAGLDHCQYAREVLSGVQPLKPPRRDTKGTLEF